MYSVRELIFNATKQPDEIKADCVSIRKKEIEIGMANACGQYSVLTGVELT